MIGKLMIFNKSRKVLSTLRINEPIMVPGRY